jgi:hypothetical protein
MCFLNEEVKCNALKPDGYGRDNGCPDDRPYISPIENCKCINRAELRAIETHNRGPYCKLNVPKEKKVEHKVDLIICDSQTDSDSDCVRVGNKHRKIDIKGSPYDENGVADESIYTDSDCDPRFSSCDTDSNSEFSNTDSKTLSSVSSKSTLKQKPDIKGSLAFHYAKKYGVYIETDTEEEHDHGYGYGHPGCTDRSCDTDSDT